MTERIQDFYLFPRFGVPLNAQWGNLRESFAALNAVIRNAYIDDANNNLSTWVLNALAYGQPTQRFKFRWRYSASDDEFHLQQNTTDNEANPTWTTLVKIRESDGRVTITSAGGLLVTGGFYNLGGLDVSVTQSGGAAFGNVGTLLFDSGSGFYITPDSSGRPIVSVDAAAAAGVLTTLSNEGSGAQVFKTTVGSNAQLRTLVQGSNVTISQGTNEITISSTDTGEVNTASNVGSGQGVFLDKQGVDLRFRSLIGGSGVNITGSTNEITIAAPEFYMEIKETEAGGYRKRAPKVAFDSAFFYVGSGGSGIPTVSMSATVDTASNLGGDQGLFSAKVLNDFRFKGLTAGTGISLGSSASAVTITNTFPGATVRESDGTPSFSSIDTFSFFRNHFYLEQGTDASEVLIALRENFPFLFRESEAGGYSKKRSALVFNSDSFYVDDNNAGQALVSLKGFGDQTNFVDSVERRNSLINGNFDIWQRATTFTTVDNFAYTADRWQVFYVGSTGVDGITVARSTFVPKDSSSGTGTSAFSFQYQVDTADTSIASNECYAFCQPIEGANIKRYGFGTPDVKDLTLSFWVRNNVAGTYSVFFRNALQGTARTYVADYTISSAEANVWQKRSITLRADRGGTWNLRTALGCVVGFVLACGSSLRTTANEWNNVNAYASPNQSNAFLATAGNTVRFGRIQLELGTQASEFDDRLLGEEIQLCQRYFAKTFPQSITPANGTGTTGALIGKSVNGSVDIEPLVNWFMPSTMRTTPTITLYNTRSGGTPGQWQNGPSADGANARVISNSDTVTVVDNTGISLTSTNQCFIQITAEAEF